eukprot:10138881-Karenia_brevis.AAC.1
MVSCGRGRRCVHQPFKLNYSEALSPTLQCIKDSLANLALASTSTYDAWPALAKARAALTNF